MYTIFTREDLQTLLETITSNVYYQPPETIKLSYPCIIYSIKKVSIEHADNKPYKKAKHYSIMLIDYDPDSVLLEKIEALPTCAFDLHYVANNLYHDVYTIYY